MASSSSISSRAEYVQLALQRAKKKISNLQNKLNKETSLESTEETSQTWMPSKELRDSLVDMYRDNPRVNEELRQRLPSPATQQHSNSTQQLSNSTQQHSNSTQQLSNSTQQPSNPDRSGTHLSLDQIDPPRGPQLPSSCPPSPPVSPLLHWRSASPLSPLSSRPPGGAGPMELDPSPRAESGGGGAPRAHGSPAPRRHVVSPDSSHREVMFGPITASDRLQHKNTSFLLKELERLREMNQKLQEELVQKEKELQRREVEEELREEQREARGWERPVAVLEEMLAAQKNRDQAVMSRLLLANEERDEALLRVRQVQQAAELELLPLEDPDMDVDELLRCVCDADSAQEVERCGSFLVQHLRSARQRRNDITAQEMKAVMEERDGSVAKFKRLEQEVMQERERCAGETEFLRLQKERSVFLEDQRQLQAEQQVLRANHSDGVSPQAPPFPAPRASPLLVQVQQLSKEKQNMEAELQHCQEAEREASERVRKLERLVEVLRKKVGTGSLRVVV
ncbi:mirror-image polydactyly gene 1 protein isoform X3 [Pseudoliparis swirei]|uniref:mirror-image polydactyly gene 1 protein isoform X3 n=1 Tax=Pseudoliparis swirei TaxID=2059687 RepID=UPI0024BEC22C|nr:mirror-image polydactyly gene 1 protein isoform X3 [Pseudoliparis swirei]